MINLLPNTEKKNIAREAAIRLLIIVLAIACVFQLVLVGLLAPSYILLSSNKKSLETKLDDITATAAPQAAGVEKSLTAMKSQLVLLSSGTTTADVPPSTLIADVIGAKTPGMTLDSVAYARTGDKVAIQLSGVAALQEDLLAFQAALKSNRDRIADVKYDQGFITRKSNIDFRVTVTFK